MRRTILAGVVILWAALPAQAEVATWSPGGSFGSPTYTRPIHIIDGVRSTFIGERRRLWNQARDRALSQWGLPFTLTFRPEGDQPWVATDETISTLSVNPLIVPNAIVLVRLHSPNGQDSAGWIEQMSGGICLFTTWRGWWVNFNPVVEIGGIVAHEVGHALGFGHGGTGVMSGGNRPNAEERTLAAAYYGT